MAKCETCGNDYDRPMQIQLNGKSHVFDCFECAIDKLAPVCAHCGVHIIGHGVEANSIVYCCAHCSKAEGEKGLADHVETRRAA